MNTVIFYVGPRYIVRPWHHLWRCNGRLLAEKPGSSFEEWGRTEYELYWDRVFRWRGNEWEVGGGSVLWLGKGLGWWMKHGARKRVSDEGQNRNSHLQRGAGDAGEVRANHHPLAS
jgi:hypothetical protein